MTTRQRASRGAIPRRRRRRGVVEEDGDGAEVGCVHPNAVRQSLIWLRRSFDEGDLIARVYFLRAMEGWEGGGWEVQVQVRV